ncbi:hypothetical protein BGZ95_002141 [Linnemannia exigua]|uniref:WD40 repeat-like protein n=1 Tax=Linnemannia exigua TaxID=604196 RepID=A0AAD4D5Y9_9FUNG|nr:hypothetical protein BGZ95_002141 [Linnemannia exigua]
MSSHPGDILPVDEKSIAARKAVSRVLDMFSPAKSNCPPGGEITSGGRHILVNLKTAAKDAFNPTSKTHHSVYNGLAAVHVGNSRIINRLGRFLKDEPGMDDTEEDQIVPDNCQSTSDDTSQTSAEETILCLANRDAPVQLPTSGSTGSSHSGTGVVRLLSVDKDLPSLPLTEKPYQPTFRNNGSKPIFRTPLPRKDYRFSSTPQLSFVHHLLSRKQLSTPPTSGSSTQSAAEELETGFDVNEKAWLRALEKDHHAQDRIRWLTGQLVTEFLKSPRKDEAAIAEVVLLGSVLSRKDYRGVLSSLIGQLEQEPLLDLELLQGLVQLLQDASPSYLIDDDLVRILQVLRQRLKDTYKALGDFSKPSSAHIYHLSTAVSRVLDAMIEGNVRNFQATYAWQALQFVGDDEPPLHAVVRIGGGMTRALLGVASVFKFDPDNLCNGLHELGLATGQAYDVVKASVEGVQALRASGHGAMDSVLMGFRSGAKRIWYPALQGARMFVREGRLADFERVIYNAPCRHEHDFQRGISQLLGEIAMDSVWTVDTRMHAVGAADGCPRPCSLAVRLSSPTTSPLLAKASKITALEDRLREIMSSRHKEYQQNLYIPPRCETVHLESKDVSEDEFKNESEDVSDECIETQSSSLMDKVMEFLKSDRQVFLILGDSGAGKSTFNRHLQHQLMVSYKQGNPIPLFINLPTIQNAEKELIQEHLRMLDFTDEDILQLKQDRQLVIICDGYDESQLSINLHSTNSFNRIGQWDVKMIISCRNTYLGKGYRHRFEPQPIERHRPATPHLLQEVVIIPFSKAQIVDYVEQFVQDSEVHEQFGDRSIWSVEEYVDKLDKVPKLMSLVTNPFLLVLALRALPDIVKGTLDVDKVEVTRVQIYETSIRQWLDINQKRLRDSRLTSDQWDILDSLIQRDFTEMAIIFLKNLATAIFEEQDGNPVVRYIPRDDDTTWKFKFFGDEQEVVFLRQASPLTRAGFLHRFIHRSFLEYFYDFVEQNVHQLRSMRVREYEQFVEDSYISCFAKTSLHDEDRESFSLLQRVEEFLNTDRQVFLLLGDSGSGKSTFNRHLERVLWKSYERNGRVPLFINLAAIEHPEEDMIAKYLLAHGFKEDQIEEMRLHREFDVICDGYDECDYQDNLYNSNKFNLAGQWRVKMIISCRSTCLDQDYRCLFVPGLSSHNSAVANVFQEAVIVPFSTTQIKEYVGKFSLDKDTHKLFNGREVWGVDEYMDKLQRVPNMMELAKNPSLLKLSLMILPSLYQDIPDTYDVKARFIDKWIEVSRGRMESALKGSSSKEKTAFEGLVNEGFAEAVIDYCKDLAMHIIKSNDNNPFVQYEDEVDRGTWKEKFFGPDTKTKILRESSPVAYVGKQYQFIHRSLVEHFYSLSTLDEISANTDTAETQSRHEPEVEPPVRSPSPVSHPPPVRTPSPVRALPTARPSSPVVLPPENNIPAQYPHAAATESTTSPSPSVTTSSSCPVHEAETTPDQEPHDDSLPNGQPMIIILAKRVKQDEALKQRYLETIERSKSAPEAAVDAAHAITVLVRAGLRFNGVDLSGVRIPGADLSGGDFDSALLSGADLTGVTFTRAWLRHANLTGAKMRNVQFGEQPYLRLPTGVNSCAYSPDGQLFAIGFSGGAISLLRPETWARVRDLAGHDWTVTSLAFSPDSLQLASASDDRLIRLWDIKTGLLQRELKEQSETVSSVVYSPKGHQIAAASQDSFVRLYSLDNFDVTLVLKGHTGPVTSVAFSLEGDLIASASHDWTVRSWDPETGFQRHLMRGHTGWVTSVSISPINKMIASCGQDKTVRLWDGRTGEPLFILRGHTAFVKRVSFSPSGHQIASGSDDCTVRLWDGLTGTPSCILSGHTQSVFTLAYAPSHQQIASGSWDARVRLWETNTAAPLDDLGPFGGSVEAASPLSSDLNHSPSSTLRRALSSGSSTNSGDHTFSFSSVACSSDGRVVSSCMADMVLLYDAETGAFTAALRGHENSVNSLAFSPDGKALVSGSYDKTARIWNVQERQSVQTLAEHTEPVTAVSFSPTGLHVATGSDDRFVRIWSVRTGKLFYKLSGHTEEIGSLSYSPDSNLLHLASGGRDMTIKLWRARDGRIDRDLKGHTNAVESVSFSSNGKRLVSGSRDKTARIWDTSSGETIQELIGHRDAVTAVAFSPNNLRIATGSWDMTVKIWDVTSGKCLVEVKEFAGEVNSIAWKPLQLGDSDGAMYFVTGCTDKSIRMWKLVESGDGIHRVQLHWRSASDGLMVSSANIERAAGLSRSNLRLLEQRGAVGEPRWN